MNYAIFTYRADEKPLKICMEQARRVDPEAQFHIFDDAKNPLGAERIQPAPDVHYTVTYFDRHGNLNGLECVRGMQTCMLNIPGDDPVVKLDADVLLMSLDEIKKSLFERNKLAGGCCCTIPLGWAGCCYWMTKKAIREALEFIARREWPPAENGVRYPEDVTMTRVCLALYGMAGTDILEFQQGKHQIGLCTVKPKEIEIVGKLARKGVTMVHCGQMEHYEPLAKALKCSMRETVAVLMEAVLNGGDLDKAAKEVFQGMQVASVSVPETDALVKVPEAFTAAPEASHSIPQTHAIPPAQQMNTTMATR